MYNWDSYEMQVDEHIFIKKVLSKLFKIFMRYLHEVIAGIEAFSWKTTTLDVQLIPLKSLSTVK